MHHSKIIKVLCFGNIVDKLSRIKTSIYILLALYAVILGFGFNFFDPMPLFIIKGPMGFLISTTLLFSLNYFRKKSEKLKFEMVGDPILFVSYKKFTKRSSSNFNYIFCFIMPIFFCLISIILKFVIMNPIGIYSLICLFPVVFLAFIVYQQYIYLLLLLWGLSRNESEMYNKLMPESTKWYKVIFEMSGNYKNLFFILGSFFVILFIIFSPYNTIEIIFFIGKTSEIFWPLLLSWIIIFFAIIVLFPVSAILRNFLLLRILQNMKSNSVEYYTELANKSRGINQILYIDIIGRVNKDTKLPQTVFSHFIPIVTTIVNFISIALTILVELKSLGALF